MPPVTLEWSECPHRTHIIKIHFPARGNCKYKGPVAGLCLSYLRNSNSGWFYLHLWYQVCWFFPPYSNSSFLQTTLGYLTIQLWHYLSRVSRPRRLRAYSHKTVPTSDSRHKSQVVPFASDQVAGHSRGPKTPSSRTQEGAFLTGCWFIKESDAGRASERDTQSKGGGAGITHAPSLDMPSTQARGVLANLKAIFYLLKEP